MHRGRGIRILSGKKAMESEIYRADRRRKRKYSGNSVAGPPFTQPQLFDASAVLTGGTEPLSPLHHSPGLKEDLLSLVESFTFFKHNLCKLSVIHALRYYNKVTTMGRTDNSS